MVVNLSKGLLEGLLQPQGPFRCAPTSTPKLPRRGDDSCERSAGGFFNQRKNGPVACNDGKALISSAHAAMPPGMQKTGFAQVEEPEDQ